MGPRRPRFTWAPVAGTGYNQVHLALREGMPRVGGWGPCRVTPCRRPQAPGITQAPLQNSQKKKTSCGFLGILTRVRTLEPRPARDCGRGRGQKPRGPGTAASSSGPQIAKLRPRTSPRSSCTMGRGMGGVGGWQEVVSAGKEERELGAGQRLRARCPRPFHAFPGHHEGPPLPGTLQPPSLGTARCPLRCTRSPALRLPPHWTPRPSRSPAGRVGTSRRGLLRVRTVPWGKPAATRDPKPCPRASSRAPRRALASQGGGRRSSRHSAAGLGCGQTRDRRSAPGPQAGPERARARSAARNHGSRRLGAQPPSALRPLLRCQGGGGGPGPGLTGRRARSRRLMSPREAVPPAPRDRAGGETPGRRARGGAHAGLRGEARGPGGESAARAARPARARRPGEEGARRRGSRGGAAPGPCPQRARPGAPGGLVGIPGTAEALISPRNWGARERCTAAPPGRSPPGCGAVGASLPPPIPSSPGPPDPLPRPDPAAKGWAGKRALWDRCQLRDKRHKIGGNGGSAAGALGRGRRRRGGRILGDDRGKFGKSPRRLRGGGGHAGRAALRAALALRAAAE